MKISNNGQARNRICATLMILVLLFSMMGTNAPVAQAAAPAVTLNLPKPGDSGYVSLHTYATPTDIQDVYKVTMTVSGYEGVTPETRVAVVIDNSSTMNTTSDGVTRYSTMDMDEYDVLFGLSGGGFWNDPNLKFVDAPDGFTNSASKLYGWTKASQTTPKTRLQAAVEGAQEAADIFLNDGRNPAPEKMKVGVSAFNGGQDVFEAPYGDFADFGAVPPGYTATDNYHLGYGDTLSGGTCVTYSTRFNPVITMHNNLNATDQYLVDLRSRPLIGQSGWTGAASPNAIADYDGMVSNDPGNLQALKDDMDERILVSTEYADTLIYGGLLEAGSMLFGNKGPSAGYQPYFSGSGLTYGYDGEGLAPGQEGYIRRFVILLSDGGDTTGFGDGLGSMELVNMMKTEGAQFMTIGIDTEGGQDPNWETAIPADTLGTVGPKAPGPYSEWEPFLVWMAANVKDPTNLSSSIGSIGSWSQIAGEYTNAATGWNGEDINYIPVGKNDLDGIVKAFEVFANRIISFGKNVFASIDLNTEYYNLYQYPGEPMFKTTGQDGQSASNAGGSIMWNMKSIPLTGENKLVFYLKMDTSKTDPSLWYPITRSSYLSYVETVNRPDFDIKAGDTIIKYFPEPIINVSGEIKADEPAATPEPTPVPNALVSVPMGVWPLKDNSRAPYTPSVTPKPTK